jgi:hypothetical protein
MIIAGIAHVQMNILVKDLTAGSPRGCRRALGARAVRRAAARRPAGSAALPLCTTAHPLHTGLAEISGAPASEPAQCGRGPRRAVRVLRRVAHLQAPRRRLDALDLGERLPGLSPPPPPPHHHHPHQVYTKSTPNLWAIPLTVDKVASDPIQTAPHRSPRSSSRARAANSRAAGMSASARPRAGASL